MKVAIIGCGPAGLLAAHAVAREGCEPVIYSRAVEKSPTAQGVFLHSAIPEASAKQPDGVIRLVKRGTGSGYAAKVYGDADRRTSWSEYSGHWSAWFLAPVYDALWALYSGSIREWEIGLEEADALSKSYELVINTAPLGAICEDPAHEFPSRPIWLLSDAALMVGRNSMVYNGDLRVAWYRSSDLFGVRSTEFASAPPLLTGQKLREGMKVLPTDCDCFPSIVRAGRWGRWKPGVLLHHAFETATKAVRDAL